MEFKERDSFLHGVDPRAKLFWLAGLTFFLAFFKLPAIAVLATLANLVLLGVSGISVREIWRDARGLLLFALIPIPLLAVSHPGTPLFSVWFVTVTWEGIVFGVVNSVCLANIMLSAMLFVYTTRQSGIVDAFSWFKAPNALSFPLALGLRFTPLLLREAQEVRAAQASRGARIKGPLSVFPLIIPVTHKAFKRAADLAVSLESRGFSPEMKRNVELKFKAKDGVFALAGMIFFAFLALAALGVVFL